MDSPYLADILVSSRRLLTLMNRNPFDSTSGSFDRNYWHFKTSDFSSATFQMGIGILAKLWVLEGSPYFKKQVIIDWIELGIEQLNQIQHSDGSFDEWYVNERGWAGPTGYIMNACLDCYELVGDAISQTSKEKLEKVIDSGVDFLKCSDEGHMISNHVAIVYLPLVQALNLMDRNDLGPRIRELKEILLDTLNEEEGWSLEYDGADPGYQSGTLSFLAKSLKYYDNPEIRHICERSLDFTSYFAFPSGNVGGAVGSRHTVTFFCAGIEALRDTPLGARLSRFMEVGIQKGKQVLSSDLDDHYLVYRLYEFLDAHSFWISRNKGEELKLPYELGLDQGFEKTFDSANIFIKATEKYYASMALNKGGALRVECPASGRVLIADSGILAKQGAKTYSSLSCAKTQWRVQDGSIDVEGELIDVSSKVFSPAKFILFRLFMLCFGFNHKVANRLKKAIKSALIFHSGRGDSYKRIIQFNKDSIEVTSKLYATKHYTNVHFGGEFWTRYVPQSRHFLEEHLNQSAPYHVEKNVNGEVVAYKEVGW